MLVWLLLLCLCVIGLSSDNTKEILSLEDVNTTWFRSVLIETFGTTRHYVTGKGNKTKAREFIAKHFENLSLTVQYDEFHSENLKIPGVNIIGILPGIQRNDSTDTIYMIGAYYDTRRMTEGIFMNGAGVVAMLEAARLLRGLGKKNNTILFVAFDLHATDDQSQERCCQGAKHFVNVWVPHYIQKRNTYDKKANFGGAMLLESILNFDSVPRVQSTNIGHYTYQLMFKDLLESVEQNRARGDFILVVCRTKDTQFQTAFMKIWDISSNVYAKIQSLQFSLIFSNSLVYEIIERSTLPSDVFAFYRKDFNAILITDTERYRGHLQTCFEEYCDERSLLSVDKILFVTKTIRTVALTLELLADGRIGHLIQTAMSNSDNVSRSSSSNIIDKGCPNTYTYDRKYNIYYKQYDDPMDKSTWSEAKAKCESESAELLILRNTNTLDYDFIS